jgi:hypothetical protein
MIVALLLASAPVATAVDAERAFAGDAQKIGMWTAFRKWSDHDAVVFTPQAGWAREVLPKKDPPKSISWRPAHRSEHRPLVRRGGQDGRLLHHRLAAHAQGLALGL